jgi:hypothetical protein
MLGISFVILALVAVVAYAHAEICAAWYGLTLSNGVDVLVSPEMYGEIVERHRTLFGRDDGRRWDRAILMVLRAYRPNETRFLSRSLGLRGASDGTGKVGGGPARRIARFRAAGRRFGAVACPRLSGHWRPGHLHLNLSRPRLRERSSRPARRRG